MTTRGEDFRDTVKAGADLRNYQYRVISIAGTLATEADVAAGILYNKPNTNEAASVGVSGRMIGVAGGAISAQDRLTVASGGFLVTVSSGDGVPVGKNVDGAVNSGDHFTFLGAFQNATTKHDNQ